MNSIYDIDLTKLIFINYKNDDDDFLYYNFYYKKRLLMIIKEMNNKKIHLYYKKYNSFVDKYEYLFENIIYEQHHINNPIPILNYINILNPISDAEKHKMVHGVIFPKILRQDKIKSLLK